MSKDVFHVTESRVEIIDWVAKQDIPVEVQFKTSV